MESRLTLVKESPTMPDHKGCGAGTINQRIGNNLRLKTKLKITLTSYWAVRIHFRLNGSRAALKLNRKLRSVNPKQTQRRYKRTTIRQTDKPPQGEGFRSMRSNLIRKGWSFLVLKRIQRRTNHAFTFARGRLVSIVLLSKNATRVTGMVA